MAENLREETYTDRPRNVRRAMGAAIDAVRASISRLLRVSDARKAAIYPEVSRGAAFNDLNYWLETFFSLGIATLGLIIGSPAVVIGAMLISPLMGPIIANGLALALGDFYLGIKSLISILLSILASVALAALITWILPFRTPTAEILARVQPTLLDLGVAILSGAAGAVVVCRGGAGGGITALPGVAVAVALMPPLAVVGFGVGIGWDWHIIRGGGLLFLTNLVAIILTSFLVFFSVRMDAPHVRKSVTEWLQKHEEHDEFYEFLERSPLRRMVSSVGSLPRRLVIMGIFLTTVSFPLTQTLVRLRDEAQIRRIVAEELYREIPRDVVFREDLEITAEAIRLRLVAVMPQGFSQHRRAVLEEIISRRADRRAQVMVYDVATRDEVSTITGQLAARTAAAMPPPISVEQARVQMWQRIQPAVIAAWPEGATLLSYNLVLNSHSPATRLEVIYLAEQDFGPLGEDTFKKAVRERAGTSQIETSFERVASQFPLRFAGRSAVVGRDLRASLDQAAVALRRFPNLALRLEFPGKELSRLDTARAAAVQEYLSEKHSLAADRIAVVAAPGESSVARLVLAAPRGG